MGSIQSNFINYSIKIGSKDLANSYAIQSVMVDKRINKIPYAKIVLHDDSQQPQAFAIANDKIFAIGGQISQYVLF